MPANVVKTKEDERLWNKAKGLADEAGKKDNWAYVMGIFQKMKGKAAAQRVVAGYLAAYDEGHKNPDGWGWENGEVGENEFHGEGSGTPPLRDGMGQKELEKLAQRVVARWIPPDSRDENLEAGKDRREPPDVDGGSQVPPARDSWGKPI